MKDLKIDINLDNLNNLANVVKENHCCITASYSRFSSEEIKLKFERYLDHWKPRSKISIVTPSEEIVIYDQVAESQDYALWTLLQRIEEMRVSATNNMVKETGALIMKDIFPKNNC